ncbi:GNAT family N-acetyltransferase [Arthrobacter tecti]
MPTVELLTARLVLTQPRPEDADGVLEVLSDPRAVEHNPSDRVDNLELADALVARWSQH